MDLRFHIVASLLLAGAGVSLGLISTQVEAGIARSHFGESCDQTLKCNKSQWLSCQNGICDCTRPEEMVYDLWKGKCVSKAGERCKFEVDETVLDEAFWMFEKAECVTNGECSPDGTCVCKPTFYDGFNGTCLKQGQNDQQCETDDECRSDKFLTCINGRCGCNSTLSIFSSTPGQCVGLAGQNCLNGNCTSNAKCDTGTNSCSCAPSKQFYADEAGLCQPRKSYGEKCSRDEECIYDNIYMTCENGTCGCAPSRSYQKVHFARSFNQYYNKEFCDRAVGFPSDLNARAKYCEEFAYDRYTFDQDHFECVGRANQKCNGNQRCVPNSFCEITSNRNPLENYATKICRCGHQFAPTSTEHCGYGYDQDCKTSDRNCSDIFSCTEGKCKCKYPAHQVYDPTLKKCQSLVGGPCQADGDCIPNSYCNLDQISNVGQCECQPGFIENVTARCDLALGSKCEYGSLLKCDTLAQLQCRDSACSCPDDFRVYDEKLRKCVGLVGSRCVSNGPPCVNGATCEVMHLSIPGRCKCDEGFVVTTNRTCTPNQSTQRTTNETIPERTNAANAAPQTVTVYEGSRTSLGTLDEMKICTRACMNSTASSLNLVQEQDD